MPPPNTVGSMRWSVQYQTQTQASDAYGQPVPATASAGWSTVSTHMCEVRSPSGRELLNAGQLKAVVSHAVETRWPGAPFDPRGRLAVDGRYFQVVSSYDPDGRRRRLVTFCTELAR
jgi:head-tail adaptor